MQFSLGEPLEVKLHKTAWGLAREASHALEKESEMTFSQFMLMASVGTRRADCTQKQVAGFRQLTEAAISRQVDELVKRGWLERTENQNNRRENKIGLTEEGKAELEKAVKIVRSKFGEIFNVLNSEEKANMENGLDKLIGVLYPGLAYA